MHVLQTCLVVIAIPIVLLLAGYPLAARLKGHSGRERAAAATLVGLAAILWSVSVINLFRPLAGAWAWVCLWPSGFALIHGQTRRALIEDFRITILIRRSLIVVLSALAFLIALLWPLLTRPSLVYYDGTGNHDAYFWISGADHLQHHGYLSIAKAGRESLAFLDNITGLKPEWGRMGAEGLLALIASLGSTSPLQIYVAATAALFVPWIAAVWLVARTFFSTALSRTALVALAALQPMFVFFHGNANLPNLLGTLMGATVVIATERSMRTDADRERVVWLVALALTLHALLCSYPEMLPFIALPTGLLWMRGVSNGRSRTSAMIAAVAGALLINPITPIRAWSGWQRAVETARLDLGWANIFLPLEPSARAPALATLSVHLGHDLGFVAGAACSLLLTAVAIVGWRRAHDRFGALAIFSGAAVLLLYTLVARFNYGWQKTAQFSAVFIAALLPVATLALLDTVPASPPARRMATRFGAIALLALFGYATIVNCYESQKWSHRKFITGDWFALRDYAHTHLRGQPVAIDGDSFRYRFFETMWAAYFLADTRVEFTSDNEKNGGYLFDNLAAQPMSPANRPRAVLVGAATLKDEGAHSRVLWRGETAALLSLP
jgi:hypothetical protein